uniref:Uncharacterized protein n=1 Tax=Steinernema glaseri TaxID=37863 RepID=A0A1I7Z697_9BILA
MLILPDLLAPEGDMQTGKLAKDLCAYYGKVAVFLLESSNYCFTGSSTPARRQGFLGSEEHSPTHESQRTTSVDSSDGATDKMSLTPADAISQKIGKALP